MEEIELNVVVTKDDGKPFTKEEVDSFFGLFINMVESEGMSAGGTCREYRQ